MEVINKKYFALIVLFIAGIAGLSAQNRLTFRVTEFAADPFDLSARDKQYEKFDGSGDRYAIIKVTSEQPDDKLNEYRFNFGNMMHTVEEHDGMLWIYVQKNAKQVTISRNGYAPINRYNLNTTIESGKNYVMKLSAEARRIVKQMVQFNVEPSNISAVVMTKEEFDSEAPEELFGTTDATGGVAKALQYGTYTYRVLADRYQDAIGRFTLNDRTKTHVENVSLQPNFADIKLEAEDSVEIYINGELMGTGSWSGQFEAGNYQIESRLPNHKPSTESLTVVAGQPQTVRLQAPSPLTGTLAVTSNPLGADILIDDKSYGLTPGYFDLPIGKYTLNLSKNNYNPAAEPFEIKENEITELNLSLAAIAPQPIKEPQEIIKPKEEVPEVEPATKPEEAKSINIGPSRNVKQEQKSPRKVKFYVEAGANLGSAIGATASLGINFGKLNAEIGYVHNFSTAEVFFNYNGLDGSANRGSYTDDYKASFTVRAAIGYNIDITKSFMLTPKLGSQFTKLKANDGRFADGANCTSLVAGLRALYAFNSHFGLSLTPEYGLGIIKSRGYKDLSKGSSEIKNFAEGFNVKLALTYTF